MRIEIQLTDERLVQSVRAQIASGLTAAIAFGDSIVDHYHVRETTEVTATVGNAEHTIHDAIFTSTVREPGLQLAQEIDLFWVTLADLDAANDAPASKYTKVTARIALTFEARALGTT